MSLNWEKCNKQNRMWKQGVEVVSRSRPSRRKKRATKVGDALLELEPSRESDVPRSPKSCYAISPFESWSARKKRKSVTRHDLHQKISILVKLQRNPSASDRRAWLMMDLHLGTSKRNGANRIVSCSFRQSKNAHLEFFLELFEAFRMPRASTGSRTTMFSLSPHGFPPNNTQS